VFEITSQATLFFEQIFSSQSGKFRVKTRILSEIFKHQNFI